LLKAEPEPEDLRCFRRSLKDLRCFRQSLNDLRCFRQSLKDFRCFGQRQSPEDLLGTAAAAAEGGRRDTRVLGYPMDLFRCQEYQYLAQCSGTQYKQAQTRHRRQKVRQDGEKIVIREMRRRTPFPSAKISRLLLVDKSLFLFSIS
jgi:hypothetical protein